MGKMISLCVVFILCLGGNYLYSQTIRKELNACYSGAYTGIDTLLDINGYFVMTIEFEERKATNDRCLVFYKDGIFLYTDCTPPPEGELSGETQTKYIPIQGRWGSYVIENDTIKAQTLESPMSSTRFAVGDIWFKIIGKDSISHININATSYLYSVKYVPAKDLPNPDESWLKRKKWFWCDKEAYKQWKKSRNK